MNQGDSGGEVDAGIGRNGGEEAIKISYGIHMDKTRDIVPTSRMPIRARTKHNLLVLFAELGHDVVEQRGRRDHGRCLPHEELLLTRLRVDDDALTKKK